METFLRDWRQDAYNKAQYDSAIFIGDKLLALTGDDKDAFWLAQVHFSMGNYTRAQALLSKSDLVARNVSCRYLAAHCLIKQNRFDDALAVLGERNPTHLIPTSANKRKAPSGGAAAAAGGGSTGAGEKVGSSTTTGGNTTSSHHPAGTRKTGGIGHGGRTGAATWGLKGHGSSKSISGDKGDRRKDREASMEAEAAAAAAAAASAAAAAAAADEASNRRCEAGMCYLRGICYAKQNVFDLAKECYKDAVRIDVQCFEAFQQLTKNQLMAPDEEWEFLESLNFGSITVGGHASSGGDMTDDAAQEAADFTRMLYSTRLSKYRNPEAFAAAAESLASHYRLGNNADLLLARGDLAYTQCRYEDALALTTAVLEEDRYNFGAYPLHLACLFELRMKNMLFLVAHDLADQHPEEPCTWLAVGVYYFATDRIAEARRYFSKASMMDAHYGPAWIGFAHTFAAEGEHDQAISAYSTAARLFTGTHLPQVFLGMQHHAMNNMTVAEEFLKTAYGLCRDDPLLLNEMGVVCYHQDRPKDAATLFRKALEVADDMDCDPQAWLGTRINLGHAFRRMGMLSEALAQFDEVLRLGGKNAAVFCAKGLIQLERGKPGDAAIVLHEALAMRPQDPIATELLNKALDEIIRASDAQQPPWLQQSQQQQQQQRQQHDRSGHGSLDDDDDDDDYSLEPTVEDDLSSFEHDLLMKRRAARQRLAEAAAGGPSSRSARLLRRQNRRKSKGKGKSSGRGGMEGEDVGMEGAGDVGPDGDGVLLDDDGGGDDDGHNGVPQHRLRKMVRNPYMAQLQRQMQMQHLDTGDAGPSGSGSGSGSRSSWPNTEGARAPAEGEIDP